MENSDYIDNISFYPKYYDIIHLTDNSLMIALICQVCILAKWELKS